ncbi:hypothetical protein LUZ60_011747 [Juncus effusus]|nr:hypothetical protein LUZ60_011747 [Juncus effusus]
MKLGRKRVRNSPVITTPKRRRNGRPQTERTNIIETSRQDLLVKVMCKTDYRDLKNLLLLSKTFHEAAQVAKDIHPSYSAPVKQDSKGFQNLENYKDTPDVVIRSVRHNYSYSLSEKNIDAVAVVLFEDDEDYLD